MARIQVMTKKRTHCGHVYEPQATVYEVEISNNEQSITIYKEGVKCKTFHVGDTIEEDSYNLSYFATIRKITKNSLTVDKKYGGSKRMDFNTFCWRNWNFDVVKASADNLETMMYI
jgi:hypothetical protein